MKTEQKEWWRYTNNFFKFAYDMHDEQRKAKAKFPGNERLLGALMEEVGELAEALLKIKEAGASPNRVYEEAIQVAVVAYRIASEGEPTYGYRGTRCNFLGCPQQMIGGPCPLCVFCE